MSTPTALVLASASPRRRELLAAHGIACVVDPSSVPEAPRPDEAAADFAARVAGEKASEVARRHPHAHVLGADTVVVVDGAVFGKPADADDARRIVRMLFSAPHKVITGLALVWRDRGIEQVRGAVTVVIPRALTEAQVEAHIRGGDWEGKAGAYGIQECGDAFVERIDGSFTNVMGLPMELVEEMLKLYNMH